MSEDEEKQVILGLLKELNEQSETESLIRHMLCGEQPKFNPEENE